MLETTIDHLSGLILQQAIQLLQENDPNLHHSEITSEHILQAVSKLGLEELIDWFDIDCITEQNERLKNKPKVFLHTQFLKEEDQKS